LVPGNGAGADHPAQVPFAKQNLQAAIERKRYEFREMYPAFIQEAEAEGNKAALISFRNANAVEKTYYALYSKALETLESGKDLTPAAIYICDVCGHTHVGKAPERCPVCGAAKSKFKEVVQPDDLPGAVTHHPLAAHHGLCGTRTSRRRLPHRLAAYPGLSTHATRPSR
jgi:hypothetical protein